MSAPGGEVAAHFDERAADYAKTRSWVNDRASLVPIARLLQQQAGGAALEIGAGTGAVACECAPSVSSDGGLYVGVDVSYSMLRQHAHYASAVAGDAHRLPFASGSIRTVICRQSIHYFETPEVVLAEIGRVLAPQGRLLIAQIVPFADPDDQAWWQGAVTLRQPLRRHRWTSSELEDSVRQAGFAVKSVEYLQRPTSLKAWLDRYRLDSHARQALIEHFTLTPLSVRELRGFVVSPGEIEYSLQWVFITARPVNAAARTAKLADGSQR